MALRSNEILDLYPDYLGGKLAEVGITDGPNDWDLFLCLRGTVSEVNFFIDQPIRFAYKNSNTFFDAHITAIWLESDDYFSSRNKLIVEGRINRGGRSIKFRMSYDTKTRKGQVIFNPGPYVAPVIKS